MYLCYGKDVLVEMVLYKVFVYYYRFNFIFFLESGDFIEKFFI